MSKEYMDEKESVETLNAMGIKKHDGKEINSDNFKRDELISLIKFYNSKGKKVVEKPVEVKKEKVEFINVTPKKDWMLHCPPDVKKLQLVEGVSVDIPVRFKKTLETEKVI